MAIIETVTSRGESTNAPISTAAASGSSIGPDCTLSIPRRETILSTGPRGQERYAHGKCHRIVSFPVVSTRARTDRSRETMTILNTQWCELSV
jgi:hypothetical protein